MFWFGYIFALIALLGFVDYHKGVEAPSMNSTNYAALLGILCLFGFISRCGYIGLEKSIREDWMAVVSNANSVSADQRKK